LILFSNISGEGTSVSKVNEVLSIYGAYIARIPSASDDLAKRIMLISFITDRYEGQLYRK